MRSSVSLVLDVCTAKASVTEARGPEEEYGIPEVDYLRVHFGMEELTSNRHGDIPLTKCDRDLDMF